MYCVKDAKLVFSKVSERYLSSKYACATHFNMLTDFSDVDNSRIDRLLKPISTSINKKISNET
jgi:hypothetical protein